MADCKWIPLQPCLLQADKSPVPSTSSHKILHSHRQDISVIQCLKPSVCQHPSCLGKHKTSQNFSKKSQNSRYAEQRGTVTLCKVWGCFMLASFQGVCSCHLLLLCLEVVQKGSDGILSHCMPSAAGNSLDGWWTVEYSHVQPHETGSELSLFAVSILRDLYRPLAAQGYLSCPIHVLHPTAAFMK